MKVEKFEDLVAWQEARILARLIYEVTRTDAFAGDRDLIRQVRRAAVSIMSNIAEGFTRYSFKDSKQFFVIARSSVAELRSHMYVASDEGYLGSAEWNRIAAQLEVVGRLVWGLIRNARKQIASVLSDEPLSR